MARLEQVNIVVRDMEAMAGFYRRLGLELRGDTGPWAPHHRNTGTTGGIDVDLDSDAFASVWNRGWPGGPGMVLGFRVEDREAVDRTAPHRHRPAEPPGGHRWRTIQTPAPTARTPAPPRMVARGSVSARITQPTRPRTDMARGHRRCSGGSVQAEALAMA